VVETKYVTVLHKCRIADAKDRPVIISIHVLSRVM